MAWGEVHQRFIPHHKYEKLFLREEKFLPLRDAAIALRIPCLFVVLFEDQVRYIDLTTLIRPERGWASRGDMKHKRQNDVARCIYIPVVDMPVLATSRDMALCA